VDDAKRYVTMPKSETAISHLFETVQGYCDLLADLSLVIKMGCNVKKCTMYLYNIPDEAIIPEFISIAWAYDAHGPAKGSIVTVAVRNDSKGNMLIHDVPYDLNNDAPDHIQRILAQQKYLGVSKNAQQESSGGKVGLVCSKANSIQEARFTHNMLVC
jgi:hypothetical protein